MAKQFGSVIDILFLSTYSLLVFFLPDLQEATNHYPMVHYRMGFFTLYLYPIMCLFMMQKTSCSADMQDGLRSLSGALWKWYSWPLGIIFWIGLVFHSVTMAVSHIWGETIHGIPLDKIATAPDYAALIIGALFLLVMSVVIAAYMGGYDRRKINSLLSQTLASWRGLSRGELIGYLIMMTVFLPLLLFLVLVILFILPFYLYCIVWGFLFSRAKRNSFPPPPVRDTKRSAFLTNIVFAIYSLVMAFFFDSIVLHMVGISRSDPSYFSSWFSALFVLVIYFIPYRIFFALKNRGNLFGWATFVLNAAVVFFETWMRFQ